MQLHQASLIVAIALSILLSGCGGGSEAPFPLSGENFTPDCLNETDPNQFCKTPGTSTGGGEGGITQTNGTPLASSVILLLDKLDTIANVALDVGKESAIALTVFPDPIEPNTSYILDQKDCDNFDANGTYLINYRDAANQVGLYGGDTFSIEFQSCELHGVLLSGTIILTKFVAGPDPATLLSEASPWNLNANIDLSTLIMGSGNNAINFSGMLAPFNASFDYDTLLKTITFGDNQLNNDISLTFNAIGESDKLSNFSITITDNLMESPRHRWAAAAGTLLSRITGSNALLVIDPGDNTAPIEWIEPSTTPHTGRIELFGGRSSNMEIYIRDGSVDLSIIDPDTFTSDPTSTEPFVINTSWAALL